MPKDTRIFRVTKQGSYGGPKTTFHTRTSVSAMFGSWSEPATRPDIKRLEYTNAEATAGWTNCIEEFRSPEKPALVCPYHKHYTGVQKPKRYNPHWYAQKCLCWKIYCSKHPDYPMHDRMCDHPSDDPAACACDFFKKIFDDVPPGGNDPDTQ